MAVIYIKKFGLRRNGKVYEQGEFVDLPDNEAKALIDQAPDEFEIVNKSDIKNVTVDPKTYLNNLSMKEMVEYAKNNNIDLGDAKTKNEIKAKIEVADDVILPDIDPTAGIKIK